MPSRGNQGLRQREATGISHLTNPSPPPRAFLILGATYMQDKITIADAPDCLNTNDRAINHPEPR
jgi:hypothetical protein